MPLPVFLRALWGLSRLPNVSCCLNAGRGMSDLPARVRTAFHTIAMPICGEHAAYRR